MFGTLLSISVASATIATVVSAYLHQSTVMAEARIELGNECDVLASTLNSSDDEATELSKIDFGAMRATLVTPSGEVLYDSRVFSGELVGHEDRPEIVEAANKVMQRTISRKNLPADDCLTTSEIAKLYGIETKDLNHLLVDKGVQFWNGARYKLTEAYAGNDYGKLRKFHYYALDGEKKERTYLVWTPKGAEMINKMMKMKE